MTRYEYPGKVYGLTKQEIESIDNVLDLSAELKAIAAGLNACFTFLKEWDSPERKYDQPSPETLAEMIYGLERHLLRVSEEWLSFSNAQEDRINKLVASNQGKKEHETE